MMHQPFLKRAQIVKLIAIAIIYLIHSTDTIAQGRVRKQKGVFIDNTTATTLLLKTCKVRRTSYQCSNLKIEAKKITLQNVDITCSSLDLSGLTFLKLKNASIICTGDVTIPNTLTEISTVGASSIGAKKITFDGGVYFRKRRFRNATLSISYTGLSIPAATLIRVRKNLNFNFKKE